MVGNPIKELITNGQPIINGWLSMGSSIAAEIQAELGYDSLTADMQHGLLDYKDAAAAFMSISASGVIPLARVPWLEPGIIMKTLDAGAMGIICPMINNREQAESFVSYVHYPPKGVRSFGPTRAKFSMGANYISKSNEGVTCLAMIETEEAFNNLEDIVSTPGLDGIYIGPADLTISLSHGQLPPGFDSRDPIILDAIKTILEAAKRNNILASLHCGSSEYAAEAIGWGFDLVTLSTDAGMLREVVSQRVSKVKSILASTEN